MTHYSWTRRDFLRIGSTAAAAGAIGKVTLLDPSTLWASANLFAGDPMRFASIGTGVKGCELLRISTRVPGAECVAVCDLYDGRHTAAREVLGKEVPGTRSYKEILDRKDVEAVIVATPDHWHRKIVEDACAAGKDVYCEKPMSHSVEDGFAMVDAVQKNNRIMQVGSQRVSSILYAKAKDMYSAGQLGKVYAIDAHWDRNSASGAWVYPIPPDASEQTIDWATFCDGGPKRPFDPVRFFRWRCFTDYGEGLAGDLFVHLLSGIHFITGTNMVAQRAQSAGGLFRWKDGREFPDLIETTYDYPDFRVSLRCNLNNEGGEFIAFYGTEGTLIIQDGTLTYKPQDTRPQPEGYSIYGWPEKLREEYLQKWHDEHPRPAPLSSKLDQESESYSVPPGYSDGLDHQMHFFTAVRTRKPTVENEVFGNHAAIGCHLANFSYFNKTAAVWDAGAKKIVKG